MPYTDIDRFGDLHVSFHELISAQPTTGLQAQQDALKAGLKLLRDAYAVNGRPKSGCSVGNWEFIAENGQPDQFDAKRHTAADHFPVEIRARHKEILADPPRDHAGDLLLRRDVRQSLHTFRGNNPVDPSIVLDFTTPEQVINGAASAILRVEKPPGTEQIRFGNWYATGFR